MRKKVLEESALFVSILKWLSLATCIGIIVGISTAVFLGPLNKELVLASGVPYYYLFIPVGLLASTLFVKYFALDARGYGTEKLTEAVHQDSGKDKAFCYAGETTRDSNDYILWRFSRERRACRADRRSSLLRVCRFVLGYCIDELQEIRRETIIWKV
jgi:hypothetical protein